MAKKIFEFTVNTDNVDPELRCYYDYVDWPIESNASKEEIDVALKEIFEQMAAPNEEYGTAFHAWFYNKLFGLYKDMCDNIADAIDEYVYDELTARFKED